MSDDSGAAACYIARRSACGCAVAVQVDAADDADILRRHRVTSVVAGWHRAGYVIERTTVAVARRTAFARCPHQTVPPRRRRKRAAGSRERGQAVMPGMEVGGR